MPKWTVADRGQRLSLGLAGVGEAEHVASGSFADVYRAEHATLGRTVAVKILRTVVPERAARVAFERDCQVMASVSEHANLVNVYTGGLTGNGLPYLVSDWFAGGSLADRLRRRGALETDEALDLIVLVAEALGVAHRAGVLHRDVKPSNILLTLDGQPALGDVGIARLEGRHQVASTRVPNGFQHTAPEVLEGMEPTEASDIYSLGSSMFEILTGQPPYVNAADESVWPLMKRVLSEPFPDCVAAGLDQPLADVVTRATQRDPNERYRSVDELLADLQLVRRGSPAAAEISPQFPSESDAEAGTDLEVATGPDPLAADPLGEPPLTDSPVPDAPASPWDQPLPPVSDAPASPWEQAPPAPPTGGSSPGFQERIEALRSGGSPSGPGPMNGQGPPDLFPANGQGPSSQVPSTGLEPGQRPPAPPASAPSADTGGTRPGPGAGENDLARDLSGAELDLHNLLSEDGDRPGGSAGSDSIARGLLVGLAAVVVLGGLAWLFGLTDRFGGGASASADGPAISIAEALAGPLEAGQPYAVGLIDSVAADATYRLLINGTPVGEPTPSLPEFVAVAGRHDVQLEVTSAGSTSVSPPISYYASVPIEPGYRAHLARVEVEGSEWSEVLAIYDTLADQNHSPLQVLDSDEVAGVSPGQWLIAVSGFGANGAEADAYCAQASLPSPDRCWAGFVEARTP